MDEKAIFTYKLLIKTAVETNDDPQLENLIATIYEDGKVYVKNKLEKIVWGIDI
jgi:hypothetical protein